MTPTLPNADELEVVVWDIEKTAHEMAMSIADIGNGRTHAHWYETAKQAARLALVSAEAEHKSALSSAQAQIAELREALEQAQSIRK